MNSLSDYIKESLDTVDFDREELYTIKVANIVRDIDKLIPNPDKVDRFTGGFNDLTRVTLLYKFDDERYRAQTDHMVIIKKIKDMMKKHLSDTPFAKDVKLVKNTKLYDRSVRVYFGKNEGSIVVSVDHDEYLKGSAYLGVPNENYVTYTDYTGDFTCTIFIPKEYTDEFIKNTGLKFERV